MNSEKTIAVRMEKAGLPYEITSMNTPMFMLSGCHSLSVAVVAIWRDSLNDDERAFVGFHAVSEAERWAVLAKHIRGVHSVALVRSEFV